MKTKRAKWGVIIVTLLFMLASVPALSNVLQYNRELSAAEGGCDACMTNIKVKQVKTASTREYGNAVYAVSEDGYLYYSSALYSAYENGSSDFALKKVRFENGTPISGVNKIATETGYRNPLLTF